MVIDIETGEIYISDPHTWPTQYSLMRTEQALQEHQHSVAVFGREGDVEKVKELIKKRRNDL